LLVPPVRSVAQSERDLGRGYGWPNSGKSEETLDFARRAADYDSAMDAEELRRRALTLLADGAAAEALATLETGADRAADDDPSAAAGLLVEAIPIAHLVAGPARAVSIAERAVALAAVADGLEHVQATVRLGDALSWAGRYAEATAEWRRASIDSHDTEPRILAERANALIRLGDAGAHDAAYRALVAARATGVRELVLDALNLVTAAEIQAGRLLEARRAAEQGLAEVEGEETTEEVNGVGLLAWVVALLGDEARCRALIVRAGRRHDELGVTAPGGLAEGLLSLSLGRAADAVAAFERKLAELGFGPVAAMTGFRPFAADLVEAYARAGRPEDGRRVLTLTTPVALGSGQPRLAAPMWRALGIVNDDEEAFSRALEEHATWGNRFEEARTRLAFGELLRRRRRRAEAREQLAAAAAGFAHVGSVIWRDRAIAEVRLAGERTAAPGAPQAPGPESLTRQEAEVLDLVRAGLSNRAIAERLVLSVKTVEGHLTTIYGKFGVTSRTQVLAALAGHPVTRPD
jgi:DNA-binding CsgD family transcriptional regulator